MTVDTLITNGKLVTHSRVTDGCVAVENGSIAAVGDRDSMPAADQEIDAGGNLVMPGVVDPHVHIHDMFSIDTYETATSAAALGGTTTYIDFAWQAWEGDLSIFDEDGPLLEGIERKQEKGEVALIDYGLHGAITRADPAVLDEIPKAVDAGVTSIKMFTAYEIGLPNGFMNRVFERVAEEDAVAVLHTEDGSVCDDLTDQFIEEGKGEPRWYPRSRPDYAEAMAADNALRMAQEAGAKYYGIHTSCRKSAEVIASYQTDKSMVRGETCTHYTVHDDSVYDELGNLPLIAPPIRKEDDIEAMFEYLKNGVLDVVSTDHCAYKEESKDVPNWWDCSAFGANALQTSLPVFHDEAVNNRRLSYPKLVQYMSTNPAAIFGLSEKGTLDVGTDADIVIFDPGETYTIRAADNASNADFSIYEGREVTGRVKKTLVRGELVADDGEIVGESGHGQFVERDLPDWSG